MHLTPRESKEYDRDGFVLLTQRFSDGEVETLKGELGDLQDRIREGAVQEPHGRAMRAVHGFHQYGGNFGVLPRHPRLLEPARDILGESIYVHQTKVNFKAAFAGDVWVWHQDSIFWIREDGFPSDDAVNVVLFLDEVNEFNGPLLLLPGTHQQLLDVGRKTANGETSWQDDVAADLAYSLGPEVIGRLVADHPIVAPKGPPGSVLVFHPTLVHGSAPNMSPYRRAVAIVTYNKLANAPRGDRSRRPEFMASRDFEPAVPVGDDILVSQSV